MVFYLQWAAAVGLAVSSPALEEEIMSSSSSTTIKHSWRSKRLESKKTYGILQGQLWIQIFCWCRINIVYYHECINFIIVDIFLYLLTCKPVFFYCIPWVLTAFSHHISISHFDFGFVSQIYANFGFMYLIGKDKCVSYSLMHTGALNNRYWHSIKWHWNIFHISHSYFP